MKSSLAFVVFAFAVSPAFSQSAFDREYKQLTEQHAKNMAAAVEPVERRHKEILEQLMRKATQGNDLETALKIKKELEGGAGKQAAPAAGPGAAKLLDGSRWKNTGGKRGTITLNANGTVDTSWGGKGDWKYLGDNKLRLKFENDGVWSVDGEFTMITGPDGTKWKRDN